MPRIQPNTITKTPWSFTQGGSNRRLPMIRLATESQARSVQPLIDRERGVRQANVAKAEAKARGFDNLMQTVSGAARLAGDMADRAIRMRNETFVAKKAAEYQRAVTLWETGVDEQGRHVGSLFETPYDPGDENGEGMSGATVEISKAHARWFEDQRMTPDQAEMVAKAIEPLRGRLDAAARRVDAQNHERDRVEAFAALSRSQADNYYKTGDAASLSEAALTFALSQTPRSQIANLDEWQAGGSRDPAQIQFATPAGKTAFDEAYTKANDGIQEKFVNDRLDEAVNTEDETVAKNLFAMFDASVDNESDAAAFFIKEESQEELRKKLRVAKERRESVVAGRDRERYQAAMTLSARIALGAGGDDDAAALANARAKLKPEALFEIDQFAEGIAEKRDLGQFENWLLPALENSSAEGRAALAETAGKEIAALRSPRARARARDMLARALAGDDDASKGWSADRLEAYMLHHADKPLHERLSVLEIMADGGAISPSLYRAQFERLEKEARTGISARTIQEALEAAGIHVGDAVEPDLDGYAKLGKDRSPVFVEGAGPVRSGIVHSTPTVKDSYEGRMVDRLMGRMGRSKEIQQRYELSAGVIRAAWRLAEEYETQRRMGAAKEPLAVYLKERIADTIEGRAWNDEQVMTRIEDELSEREAYMHGEWKRKVGGIYGFGE